MLWRYGACSYIEVLVGPRLLILLQRLRECWPLGEEVVRLTDSISAVVC